MITSRIFCVRHYECDAYGHLNNTCYLRYMQEAAFDASAAAGYGLARYVQMGRRWLIRESEIDYLLPVRYGDSVEVRTWVASFRRVSSRREYELRLAGSERVVARGASEWVFIDVASGRPVAPPAELVASFEIAPGETPARERFPALTPPAEGAFRMRRRVQWQDIDPEQHVNNATYLAYVEECGVQAAASFGWPMSRIAEAGFATVARRHRIEYRLPARFDDELEIVTWLSAPRHTSWTRNYQLSRVADGALLARAQTIFVSISLASGRPARLPEPLLRDFAPHIQVGVDR